jgi:hypothetical protein
MVFVPNKYCFIREGLVRASHTLFTGAFIIVLDLDTNFCSIKNIYRKLSKIEPLNFYTVIIKLLISFMEEPLASSKFDFFSGKKTE